VHQQIRELYRFWLWIRSKRILNLIKAKGKREITIEKDIIEVIIEDILYFSDDEDQQNIQNDKKKDLIGFESMTTDNEEEVYYYWAIILHLFSTMLY
jgi:hypothetical protein